MQIKVITNPDRKITQSVLYFQFGFVGWSHEEMFDQGDRFGSLPFGYVIAYENKVYLDEGGMIAPLNSQKIFNEVLADKKVFDIQGQDW